MEYDEFLNKGFVVWEAVRREWKGTSEQVAAARKRSQEKGGCSPFPFVLAQLA